MQSWTLGVSKALTILTSVVGSNLKNKDKQSANEGVFNIFTEQEIEEVINISSIVSLNKNDFIMKEDQFNSQTRRWKFYVISNKVDDYIQKQYDAFKDKGKRFLIHQAGKHEIYVMTWDYLFRTFEIKHNFLLEKLEFDKTAIIEELQLKGVNLNTKSFDKVTKQIIDFSQN